MLYSIGVRNGHEIDAWLSLVERCVRDAEVAGSNPVASIPGRGTPETLRNQGFRGFFFAWKKGVTGVEKLANSLISGLR